MEEDQVKKRPPAASDENSLSNRIEKRKVEDIRQKVAESRSSTSSERKDTIGKNKQATAIVGTGTPSELEDATEVHEGVKDTEGTVEFSKPHIPISTAKDEKTSFTKDQKKFIKVFQRDAKKLEKSVIKETEIARENKQINKQVSALTEKLVKTGSKKKIYDIIDEIKTLHRKLKRGKLKFKKERNRIRVYNKIIDNTKSGILF